MKTAVLSALVVAAISPAISAASDEAFWGVTAKTGAQWVSECEKPALKSNGTLRAAACTSFVRGAMTTAVPTSSAPFCRAKLDEATPGAVFATTIELAKEEPAASLQDIFLYVFRVAAPWPCK